MFRMMPQGPDPTQGPPSDPTQAPPDPDQDQAQEPDNDGDEDYEMDKTSQRASGYMGPEMGPFMCQNCFHFGGQNRCAIVSGDIDPAGCCNLFEPHGQQDTAQAPDQGQAPIPQAPDGEQ